MSSDILHVHVSPIALVGGLTGRDCHPIGYRIAIVNREAKLARARTPTFESYRESQPSLSFGWTDGSAAAVWQLMRESATRLTQRRFHIQRKEIRYFKCAVVP